MTIPTLMNCPHTGDGWCLDCVGKLANQSIFIVDFQFVFAGGIAVINADSKQDAIIKCKAKLLETAHLDHPTKEEIESEEATWQATPFNGFKKHYTSL